MPITLRWYFIVAFSTTKKSNNIAKEMQMFQLSSRNRAGLNIVCFTASLFGLLFLSFQSVPTGHTSVLTVCAIDCDYTTIQAAHNVAAPFDTIAILDTVHTEAGIVINKSLTIAGSGSGRTIVQAAATPRTAVDRVFAVKIGTTTFQNMTIQHGNVLTTNIIPNGGGIYATGGVILNDVIVHANTTANHGGGIYSSNGIVTINKSQVVNNYASTVNVSGEGGGIYNNVGDLTIINSIIAHNVADDDDAEGGGIYNEGGDLLIINSRILSNTSAFGGGILNVEGKAYIEDSLIQGNIAGTINEDEGGGGGIANGLAEMHIVRSTITANSANRTLFGGGGIFNFGMLTVVSSTISHNKTISSTNANGDFLFGSGGGISNIFRLTVTQSIISNNSVVGNEAGGGGISHQTYPIFDSPSIANITHSTISNNSASIGGGVLSLDTFGYVSNYMTMTHVIVKDNMATDVGGGVLVSSVTNLPMPTWMANNTVAGNVGGDCFTPESAIIPLGANLDSDGSCDGFNATADQLLSTLQGHDGSTLLPVGEN